MKRQRLAGIEKEIIKVISKVLLEEIKNPKIKGLVSVTDVRVTEDLKFADVFFSVMPTVNNKINKSEVFDALNEVKGFLRKRVAEDVEMRFIPEIRVKEDNSIENAIKITELLNKLKD